MMHSPKPMARPLMLDLYCGAGGAAMGYWRAGFDVIGVDINPQPNYPFTFWHGDALEYLRHRTWGGSTVAAIHASPSCQAHSRYRSHNVQVNGAKHDTGHLLTATRELLTKTGFPWVIENVPGAPMRPDYRLCGCQFKLPGLRRERWFECSWSLAWIKPDCVHRDRTVTVTGHSGGSSTRDGAAGFGTRAVWQAAMGIDWTTNKEMAQEIRPAYTEFVGTRLQQRLSR